MKNNVTADEIELVLKQAHEIKLRLQNNQVERGNQIESMAVAFDLLNTARSILGQLIEIHKENKQWEHTSPKDKASTSVYS